jgi:hydroxypyruvate isomerase
VVSYAPNVSWLFPETPFSERPKLVAQTGCRALEFGFPSHADLPALEAAVRDLGLEVVLFNQDVPLWDAANRGYLVDRRRKDEFRRTLDQALEICRRLGARKVMLPAGVELQGVERKAQQACLLENLRLAAPLAAEAGVVLTLEVLNPTDNPGYFLTSPEEARQVVETLDHPSLRMQLDTYHLGLLGYDPAVEIQRHAEWIGHIQFADFPGRHEPGSGGLDFSGIRAALEAIGYDGYIGLEYIPLQAGVRTLEWAQAEPVGKSH